MFSANYIKNAFLLITSFLVLVSLSSFSFDEQDEHPEVDFSISCVECHLTETPVQVKEWQASAHGVMSFGCYMCHGDGTETFSVRPGQESCVSCHDNKTVDTKTIKPRCFDCHQGHTLKFHNEN